MRLLSPQSQRLNRGLIMKFTNNNLKEIKKYFPKLQLIHGAIQGEIAFSAMYVQNKRGQWVIEACNSICDEKCITGSYQIEIALNQEGVPRVYETSGKIAAVAKRLKIQMHDLHINSDTSCCLDFVIHPTLTIKEFILNKVYPFFVWQAYYEKFEQAPPSGEYSHGIEAKQEFFNDAKKMGRNDICFCGSGKKHKKCCMPLLTAM